MTNRIIKFKAWSVYSKEWYSEPFAVSENGKILFHENGDSWDIPGEYEIVQFTGLLDKNGKEIYEGDFLIDAEDSEPMRHRITWIDDEARFQIETLEDEEGNWSWGLIDSLDQLVNSKCMLNGFEVIGNIYENPELLKEKDN